MKTTAFALLLLALVTQAGSLHAQLGTMFTYQGRLFDGGEPATASYELRITAFDAAEGGVALAPAITVPGVTPIDGVFTAALDFGPAVFIGTPVWLQVEIERDDSPGFVTLAPRQRVTPAPYALHAASVDVDAIDSFALRDGAVTSDKLAAGAVGATQIDAGQVQRRIVDSCGAGTAIVAIATDGGVSCAATGADAWNSHAEANTTSKRVAIGFAGTTSTARLFVLHDSTVGSPHVNLRENDQDYVRLTMQTGGPPDNIHNNFWTIAARTEPASLGGPTTDRINFFNNRSGDVMSLLGDGRLGIGVFNPQARLDVNGGARIRGLGFAGTGQREMRVTATGDLVALAPVTQYHTLAPFDFQPDRNTRTYFRSGGLMYMTEAGAGASLAAPLHLPDGAVIDEMALWYVDASASENLSVNLWQLPVGTSTAYPIAEFTTSGDTSGVRTATVTVANHIVDNGCCAYEIRLIAPSWPGSQLAIANVRLRYSRP
jgi:hypothetical protein